MIKNPREIRGVIVCSLLVVGVALIPQGWSNTVLPCAARHFFGVDCPGCGLLTSLAQLIHLEWNEAISRYPLSPVILIGLLAYIGDELRVVICQSKSIVRPILQSRWIAIGLGLIFIQWIAKLLLL